MGIHHFIIIHLFMNPCRCHNRQFSLFAIQLFKDNSTRSLHLHCHPCRSAYEHTENCTQVFLTTTLTVLLMPCHTCSCPYHLLISQYTCGDWEYVLLSHPKDRQLSNDVPAWWFAMRKIDICTSQNNWIIVHFLNYWFSYSRIIFIHYPYIYIYIYPYNYTVID